MKRKQREKRERAIPLGANIAGVPLDEPPLSRNQPVVCPGQENGVSTEYDDTQPYIPRHLATENRAEMGADGGAGESTPEQEPTRVPDPALPDPGRQAGDYIPQPDGSHIAPNGAVVRDPWSEQPEITPDHEYTPEKEDLNLMIM